MEEEEEKKVPLNFQAHEEAASRGPDGSHSSATGVSLMFSSFCFSVKQEEKNIPLLQLSVSLSVCAPAERLCAGTVSRLLYRLPCPPYTHTHT